MSDIKDIEGGQVGQAGEELTAGRKIKYFAKPEGGCPEGSKRSRGRLHRGMCYRRSSSPSPKREHSRCPKGSHRDMRKFGRNPSGCRRLSSPRRKYYARARPFTHSPFQSRQRSRTASRSRSRSASRSPVSPGLVKQVAGYKVYQKKSPSKAGGKKVGALYIKDASGKRNYLSSGHWPDKLKAAWKSS
jgi:hypothetical protein